jgi:hypothetical protein
MDVKDDHLMCGQHLEAAEYLVYSEDPRVVNYLTPSEARDLLQRSSRPAAQVLASLGMR